MTADYIQQELQKIAAVSIELKKAKDDDNYLCTLLNNLSREANKLNLKYYEQRKDRPLGNLRFEIAKKIDEGETITPGLIDEVSAKILKNYDKNVFQAWLKFGKCYSLYYNQYDEEFIKFLNAFAQQIKNDIGYPQGKAKIVDYNGARNSGSTDAWIAIYNPAQQSHSTAQQLFFNILNGQISYGVYYHPNPADAKIVKDTPQNFQYQELIDYFISQLSTIKKDNKILSSSATQNLQSGMDKQISLNTILYGPPGTGKTYNTVNKAVAIASTGFDIENTDRKKIKDEYNRLVKEGQIEFVTFHQSMSYEDFIEGIKPIEPKEDDTFLKYEIKPGIFKRLVAKATQLPDDNATSFSIAEDDFQKAGFYKLSLGDTNNPDDDQIYNWCIKNGYIAMGWGDANDFTDLSENDIQQMVPGRLEKFAAQSVNYFIHYIKPGDFVVVTYGNLQFRAIGRVTGSYEFKNVEGLNVHQFRKVEWLLKNVELPYETLYNKQFSQQTIYRLDKKEIKKDFFVNASSKPAESNKPKNYVLIIDEINRGNISQIFGELITLIEEDKRAGKDEALSIILPYSKETFTVPSNLYIIGTMNTADRSVEALDTALRRRFVFEEMQPKPELLSPKQIIVRFWNDGKYKLIPYQQWKQEPYKTIAAKAYEFLGVDISFEEEIKDLNADDEMYKIEDFDLLNDEDFSGVNLQTLLETINKRLSVLLTKDHTIGHAWLMNIYSLADLQQTCKNKIIPLLQEYFYNNYSKIGLVLGNNFIERSNPVNAGTFAKFNNKEELAEDYNEQIIYTLKDCSKLTMEDFKSIYN